MIINIKNDILSPSKGDSNMNDNFRELRKRTGMSQKEFGAAVGMPQSFVGRIENGSVNIENISLRKGYIFASALGVHIEDLIDNKRGILDNMLAKRHEMEKVQ